MTQDVLDAEVLIVALTEKGAQCEVATGGGPFWLPRSGHVQWRNAPQVGQQVWISLPMWLARKHKQLVGDVEFDGAKRDYAAPANRGGDRDMSGALSKNMDKSKENQPDYRGEIVIHGTKYRLAGWIKDGANGKFLSLAAKEDDRQ